MLWAFIYKFFLWRCMFLFLLGKFLRVKLLDWIATSCFKFYAEKLPSCFPSWPHHLKLLLSAVYESSLPKLTIYLFYYSYSSVYEVVSPWFSFAWGHFLPVILVKIKFWKKPTGMESILGENRHWPTLLVGMWINAITMKAYLAFLLEFEMHILFDLTIPLLASWTWDSLHMEMWKQIYVEGFSQEHVPISIYMRLLM